MIKGWVGEYLERVRDPIVADRSIDLMAAAFWFCISAWGLSAAITGLPTIYNSLGEFYLMIWGAAIGILCTIAFYGAISTFFSNPIINIRIKRKKVEMIVAGVAGGFIAVYPGLLLVSVIAGDWDRFSIFFASLAFLVVPTWRVRHLYHRIAKLREIRKATTETIKTLE